MGELSWPFVGSEALAAGLISERAMRALYEPMYPNVYQPWGIAPSAVEWAKGAWLWSKREGVLAGLSAAAMHGTKWINGTEPAELIHPNCKPPPKLIVRAETLTAGEVLRVDGISVTTPARTAFDIGRRNTTRLDAVKRLDALANATDVKVVDIEAVMAAHPGQRGIARLRGLLPLVDGGAESPQETVSRLVLIDAVLPRPRTQVEVFGSYGEFIARVDLAYEEVKVGIEYDGPQHWSDPAVRQRDIDKRVEFRDVGWLVIRVSRDLLKYRRGTYVHRVSTALRERGRVW